MPPTKSKSSRTRATTPTQVAHPTPTPETQATPPNQIAEVGLTYQEQTSGYLVPPMMLERYERILPGFAERWLAMMERQEAHRQTLEKHTIVGDGRRAWAGIVCAFTLCLATIIAALILALYRHDPGGTILSGVLGTTGIVGLAGVFIYGTKQRDQERERKARLMTGQG